MGRRERFFVVLRKIFLVSFFAFIALFISCGLVVDTLLSDDETKVASFGANARYLLLKEGFRDVTMSLYEVEYKWLGQEKREIFDDILAWEFKDRVLFVFTAKYQAKLDTQTNKLYAHYYVNVDEDHAERMRSLYKAGFTLVEQEDEFTAEEQAAFARLKAAYELKRSEIE